MKPARISIEMILYGLLVGLVLQGGLDTAYHSSLPSVTTWRELLSAIWVISSLQVLIFLITLIRFVFGAYRVHEEYEKLHVKQMGWRGWNFVGTLVLFILFYLAGLSIKNAQPFYACLVGVHLWDFIWFILPTFFCGHLDANLKSVLGKFLIIDFLTILFLSIWVAFSTNTSYAGGTAIMACSAIIDFWWLWKFYFPSTGIKKILDKIITIEDLKNSALKMFGDLVKAVVDVERELVAIDAELHSDLEALLIENGSKQKYLWGINFYPDFGGNDFIEFDSLINLRPAHGNMSRSVDDKQNQQRIIEVVNKWVKQ